MTKESRLLLSLDEISGLRWQCNKCESAISFQLDQTIRFPQQCPVCNQALMDQSSFGDFKQMEAFADALKFALRASKAKLLGATLKLEMVDPR
jgi:hypothetical protein